jgi:hypothetical protein
MAVFGCLVAVRFANKIRAIDLQRLSFRQGGYQWQYVRHNKHNRSCKSGGIMIGMIRAGAIGIAALTGLGFVCGAHA